MVITSTEHSRTDAFVCYSRKDDVFAELLVKELRRRDLRIVFDVDGIRGGEAWRRKLGNLIEHSDNVIFLISADSVASQYCRWELDYANTLNKRLIPVLVRSADLSEVPESVRAIQWIDGAAPHDDPAVISAAIALAVEEDQSWAEFHTQLGLRAVAWKTSGAGLLARRELSSAESLVLQYQGRRPSVTELQSAYLVESRRAAVRATSWLVAALLAVAAIIGFGVSTWLNRFDERARRQLNEAGTAFRANDVPGAVASLHQLVSPDLLTSIAGRALAPAWAPSASNLDRFWQPRLISLAKIISGAASMTLIYPERCRPQRDLYAASGRAARIAISSRWMSSLADIVSVRRPFGLVSRPARWMRVRRKVASF